MMVSFSFGTIYKFIFFIITILLFLCIANNFLTYLDLIDYKSFFNTLELSLYAVVGFTTLIILFTCLYNIYSSSSKLYGLFNILPIAFFITTIIYNIYLIVNYKNEIVKEKIFKYTIKIADFYYKESANNMLDRIINETGIKSPFVKTISKTKYRVLLGPFNDIKKLEDSFNEIKSLDFENIEILKDV